MALSGRMRAILFILVTGIMASVLPGHCFADRYRVLPDIIDPGRTYLLYMHGVWIEQRGLHEAHPLHGPYEYEKITHALSERGFTVISEARLTHVHMTDYAKKVAAQVDHLLKAGVPEEHIIIAGHSKGGQMALLVASILQKEKLRYVVMAGCGKRGSSFRRGYERFLKTNAKRLRGHILSLYDRVDRSAGTCRESFDLSPGVTSKEVVLDTKKGHGLFNTPDESWIRRILEWIGTLNAVSGNTLGYTGITSRLSTLW